MQLLLCGAREISQLSGALKRSLELLSLWLVNSPSFWLHLVRDGDASTCRIEQLSMADKRPCIFLHVFDGERRLVAELRADAKTRAPTVGVADGRSSAEPSHRFRSCIRAAFYKAALFDTERNFAQETHSLAAVVPHE